MHLIGGLAFIFVGLTLVNRVLEGQLIAQTDVAIWNQVCLFQPLNVGFFTVPVPNIQFLTEGIPHLIMWDYSFFGGNAAIFMFFLYSLTAAVSFLLFTLVLGLLYNYFSRVR